MYYITQKYDQACYTYFGFTCSEIQNKPTRRIAPTFISKKVTTSRNVFSIPTTNNVWRNPQKDDDDDELVSMLPNKERLANFSYNKDIILFILGFYW